MYWDEPVVSRWIDTYNGETDTDSRNRIFTQYLYVPLLEMAKAVVVAHGVSVCTTMTHPDMVIELVTHGTTALPTYKSGRNSYSYFNVVLRNRLWQLNKRGHKESLRMVSIDEMKEKHGSTDHCSEFVMSPIKTDGVECAAYAKKWWDTIGMKGITSPIRKDVMAIMLNFIFAKEWEFRSKKMFFAEVRKKLHEKYDIVPPTLVTRTYQRILNINLKMYDSWKKSR